MSENPGNAQTFDRLLDWVEDAKHRFNDPERPWILLPGVGYLVLGVIVFVMATKVATFVSGIGPNLRPPVAPFEWVTHETVWWMLAAFTSVACIIAGLAMAVILEYLPRIMIFDGVAGELVVRRLLRRAERRPLSDVETLKVVFDRNEGLSKNYYTVAVYRKELACPATRLNMMTSNPKDASLGGKKTAAILRVLANASAPITPVSFSEPFETSGWFSFGDRHYRLYDSFIRLFWRIVLSNALVLAGLYWLYDRFHDFVDGMLLEAFQNSFQPVLAWRILAALLAILVAVEVVFTRVGLRIDSQNRTVSFYRMFGLWRTDCAFSPGAGFYLTRLKNIHGLYMIAEKSPPVCLCASSSPERLRKALVDAGDAMGEDPWPLFHPHPVEYVPAATPTGTAGLYMRFAPYISKAEDRFEKWVSAFESWVDKKRR